MLPFDRPRARSHPQGSSPKVDSTVRDASELRSVASLSEAKSRVHSIQRTVEGNDLQHGKHGIRRDLRDHSKHTMLQFLSHIGRKVLYIAHAEHAYDLQTKFKNSTVTTTMFCQFPITSSKRAHPMGDATGVRKGRKSTMQPMSLPERQ